MTPALNMTKAIRRSASEIPHGYDHFAIGIQQLLEEARRHAAQSINSILTATHWEVGRRIVEFEQAGSPRAEYGERVLKRLSADLTARFGRGFGISNLKIIRKFYLIYQDRAKGQKPSGLLPSPDHHEKSQKPSGLSSASIIPESSKAWIFEVLAKRFPLSWSKYVALIAINDLHKREFYEEETRRGGWSGQQLGRQINSMLYERVALSRKKGELLRKAGQPASPTTPEDEIKDPYLLEFLGLPEPHSEKDLENALIRHLAEFLIELGCGFTFVARQKRLQIGSESYYLDLLFYHRGLRALVAVDLKIGKFTHADAGQMNLYLNYLKENETLKGESPPIGLILCAEKDEAVAHYALGGMSNKVFASRYKLQLPKPETIKHEIEVEKQRLEHQLSPKKTRPDHKKSAD